MTKDILKGIALALVATYFFTFLIFMTFGGDDRVDYESLRESLLGAFVGPLITSWFVIPFGAVLGVLIPRLFAGWGWPAALCGGTLLGFAAGFAGAMPLVRIFNGRHEGVVNVSLLIGVYCAPWAGVYACLRRREVGTEPRP